jgi:hypothetical protein
MQVCVCLVKFGGLRCITFSKIERICVSICVKSTSFLIPKDVLYITLSNVNSCVKPSYSCWCKKKGEPSIDLKFLMLLLKR